MFRIDLTEAGASVADLGVMLPITAALVVQNGVSATAALTIAGLLFILSGLFYGVPTPVQPIKAAAAIAIATHAPPSELAAAGLLIGVILLALAVTRTAPHLQKLFAKPIIRGNQLGVGILLVVAASSMLGKLPGSHTLAWIAAGLLLGVIAATERARRVPVPLLLVLGGVGWTLLYGAHLHLAPAPALPTLVLPGWHMTALALTALVIPQIPLTLGNAIVGTADLQAEYYGARAHRVTERNLCITCGAANVLVGLVGGMPLCHGSSGATAYHRFGARTAGVNVVIGSALVIAGVVFGRTAFELFSLIPAPVLAALLAYTGARHALLISDMRRSNLVIALSMGVVGALTRNLSWGMAVGMPAYLVLAGTRRLRARTA